MEKNIKKGLFITVDANIGAGKSNACHALASAANSSGWPAKVLEEPTHLDRFKHFLARYYDDLTSGNNTGGGFEMQMFMLSKRYEQHKLAVENAWGDNGIVVIQDRPIYGDTVFATTAMERGFMTVEEYELYVDVFKNMSRDIMPPDIFVYLNVDPEECFRRMESRARGEESGIPLDYLQHIHRNYQKLVGEMRRRGVKVLVIDWNEFGPPIDMWNNILRMINSSDSWFEQLTFSFNKHPRMPIKPNLDKE
ncbi:MAG: deoxynucleoside kinase [Ignavibacteria bacterium]|jgi:deoxyadenosine/deoxycytidine kinase